MNFVLKAIALLLLLTASMSTAQEASTENDAVPHAEELEVFVQPVVFEGEELFKVRGSSALPADERATTVAAAIEEAALAREVDDVLIFLKDSDLGIEIVAEGVRVSVITQADADYERIEAHILADMQSRAVQEAILSYRASRSEEAFAKSAKQALSWTGLFVVFCAILLFVRKRLPSFIAKIVRRRFQSVQEATKEMVQSRAVARLAQYLMRMFLDITLFVGFYYYLSFVLFAFPDTKPFASLLIEYVTDPIVGMIWTAIGYLPNLITILIIVWITGVAIRGVRLFFENVDQGTIVLKNFEPQWVWPTYTLVRLVLILMSAVLCFPYIPGSDSAAFQGLTIFLGLMVSLGSNSVISNSLAGLFVLYRRSMKVGDRIRVGDHYGDVQQIKLMETYLRSVKNELVSIPNSKLLASEVTNYSAKLDGKGLLLHTTVGIGYEEPREKIEAMLLEAVGRTNGLKKSPSPFVLMDGLADFAINYQVNAFTTRGSSLPLLLSELHKNIVDVFNENNVQIMTPSYEADTPEAKVAQVVWDGELAPNARSEPEKS